MRKYFTRSGIERSCPLQKVPNGYQWITYKALVEGLSPAWRPEIRSQLLLAIANEDVALLADVIKLVDSYLPLYCKRTDITLVREDRAVVSFLKKFPFTSKESPFDCKATALEKWHEAEQRCKETNDRLRNLSNEELPTWVWIARNLIADCLPEVNSETLEMVFAKGRHGPGATLGNTDKLVTEYYKYSTFPYHVTRTAAPYALAAISRSPRWLDLLESSGRRRVIPDATTPQSWKERQIFSDCVDIEESDKVTFVPKSMTTHRSIAIGANMNMFLQLGVNTVISNALLNVGINLYDQSRNQEMAYAGSRFHNVDGTENCNQYSTIDLAAASDTISIGIVKLLMPPEWFALLDDLRHKSGVIENETVVYSKFSAMGCGFTFSLESLIFWAVAKAAILDTGRSCATKDLSVYGDDIICRLHSTPAVISALNWAGFTINTEKSFISGPFKESCGSDYFRGQDVRAFYLKRRLRTYEDIYTFSNKVVEYHKSFKSSRMYSAAYAAAIQAVRPSHRRYSPPECGDNLSLNVPLSYLRMLGLDPWLRKDEKEHLREKGYLESTSDGLSILNDYQSPYVIQSSWSALVFKGRAKTRLMMALNENVREMPRFNTFEQMIHVQAATAGDRKSVV